ncbi:MAG TPA: glycosyltransferase family 4 protein [Thermomicrobiales bacterium]|nr:glycosyltransferase family 4 protein [Thermomicrobiales bacterium]
MGAVAVQPTQSRRAPGAAGTRPCRILFVFAWLVVGGEETEVRLLAKRLDRRRYQIDVVACFRKPGMPEQTHRQLAELGIAVDRAPYDLSFEDTVAYLAKRLPAYDLVVDCQAVHDVYPALARCADPPPLIEHGGLVREALSGPKDRTARYVGVCDAIRDAAASRMPDRPRHALTIPSMVDLAAFDPGQRAAVRAEWDVAPETPVVGWVGRLDRKKRVEDAVRAVALLRRRLPDARLVVVGGPDAFMPEYAVELRELAYSVGLGSAAIFLGDRADAPRLMAGFDALLWLSEGEGMPHVVAEAGAAGLPVVATRDGGVGALIDDGVTGRFTPHGDPAAAAEALAALFADPDAARRLGANLRQRVATRFSTDVVVPQWEALFAAALAETSRAGEPAGSAVTS